MKLMSSNDSNKKHLIYHKNNNKEIMTGLDTDEIIEKLFNLLLRMYQVGLEQSLKGGVFCFIMLINCSTSVIR